MLQQKCVKARALYDNIAEAPDELAFRKGDVLTVLEQNTAGLEGWWLCALRGRQVIVEEICLNFPFESIPTNKQSERFLRHGIGAIEESRGNPSDSENGFITADQTENPISICARGTLRLRWIFR
jgi:hypothetical protein